MTSKQNGKGVVVKTAGEMNRLSEGSLEEKKTGCNALRGVWVLVGGQFFF